MQYRLLGKSGVPVSELCFGAMSFGSQGYWEKIGGLDQAAAQRLVGIAFDSGINFFDTLMCIPMDSRSYYLARPFGRSATGWCWPPRCAGA